MSAGRGYLSKERSLAEYIGRGDIKFESGSHTTVGAVDTVATGMSTVLAVFANLDDDPVAGAMWVTGKPSATAGSIEIKGWKPTATADTAPIAATTFSKAVRWFAIGY